MRVRDALQALAVRSASQWGMFTTAQARSLGVSRLDLARLSDAGLIERLVHGVYRDTGAPSGEHDDLRALWLSTDQSRPAEDRLGDGAAGVVVSGASAASLHGVGDLRADRAEFTVPVRRQTQRTELRYRVRTLASSSVTMVEGLPVTALEQTIADLVESRTDLSLVADALRDASLVRTLDRDRLATLLAPLAARNGHRRGDGHSLLGQLARIAGIDDDSRAAAIAADDHLAELVAVKYLRRTTARSDVDVADLVELLGSPG